MSDIIIGVVEKVKITSTSNDKSTTVLARIDTGASRSSIGVNLAAELNLGPIKDQATVRNANGVTYRPVVEAVIELGGKKIKEQFTIANRNRMNYKVLVGRNVLKQGFLIDTSKENKNG